MTSNIKKLPGSQVEVQVKLEDKEFAGYYQAAEDEAAANVTLKGFRKGAAPKEMVVAALDHDKIFHTAINEAVRWSLDEIKREHTWTFIDQPRIEVTDGEPGKGISYKATLTLFPEIELGDYKKIAAKMFAAVTPVVVSDDEVTKTIEWLRGSRAVEARVARGAQQKDLVEIDIETESGGVAVPNSSFQHDRFILGESSFITGFDKHLEGKKENEVVKFSIVAPEEYWEKELRGKQLDFTVVIHGVFERTLPELNDEFVSKLGPTLKTVDDLKKNIREGLAIEKQEKENEKVRAKVLEAIAKDSKMDIPAILIERTLDSMLADMARMIPQGENKNPEALKKEMREKFRERAAANVSSNLVMYKLAGVEKLEPTAEELGAEAVKMGVDIEKEHDYIYGTLQNKKVFEFLESQAKKTS